MPLPIPHKAIWSVIPVFLMIGFFFSYRTMDIQFHDTYFVFSSFVLGLIFSTILLIIGFIYWHHREKKLIPWMTYIHVGWTNFVLGFIQINVAFSVAGIFIYHGFLGYWGLMLILFTGVVQLLLLINVRMSKV